MRFRVVALSLLLLYSLYAGAIYFTQATILFPAASSRHHVLAGPIPSGASVLEVPVSFGKARAVYWRPAGSTTPAAAIWFAHGNYETIENGYALMQPLAARGIAVLQFEYPGYGGADGAPDPDAIREAADATWDWLAQRPEVDPARMVAMGYSVGGGPAADLTQRRNVRALVLLSTFTSIADMAWRHALPPFLARFPYDNVARLREFRGPVFIGHGRRDNVIPFALGQRLAAAKPDAEFLVTECGHADCNLDHSLFATRLPEWLADQGIVPAGPGY